LFARHSLYSPRRMSPAVGAAGGEARRAEAFARSAGRERGKDGETDQQMSAKRSCRHGFEAERTTGLRTRSEAL
jgi:hypothetical protein